MTSYRLRHAERTGIPTGVTVIAEGKFRGVIAVPTSATA
jgi:hypothetical protein